MPERLTSSTAGTDDDRGLQCSLSSNQAKEDWSQTIDNLMALARRANKAFDYDRAINYLANLEGILDAKGLSKISNNIRFDLYREKGKSFAAKGKYDDAIQEYQKILSMCHDSHQLSAKSETFAQIGQLLSKQGDYDRALGYIQRAIGAYRRLHDNQGICKALRNLGVIYVELGEFEEAEINYQEAIEIARKIGNRILYADLVNNLGTIKNMKGDWETALMLYDESLQIYESEGQIRKSAYSKNNLAITLADRGFNDKAYEHFQQAYKIATQIKDESLTLIVDINLADLFLKKGILVNAKVHCHKAERYLAKSGLTNSHLVEIKKIAGKIAARERELEQALQHFNESLKLSREVGTRYIEAEVLLERGTLYKNMRRNFDSLTDLEASYQIFANLNADGRRVQTERIIYSIERLYLDIFDSMAREVDQKDQYTKGHSDRVASLALLLGKELGLRATELKTIVAASLLHDIGKINIDDSVLKKPGELTVDEFQHIKKHPENGLELLRGTDFPWDIRPLILHHHEKMDGSGYPRGLIGEDIPTGARIIGICDVFDALTSDRVYRPAYDIEKALKIMSGKSGTEFDPVILKRFIELIGSGKAEPVVNADTSVDELYGIWSQCMTDERLTREEIKSADMEQKNFNRKALA